MHRLFFTCATVSALLCTVTLWLCHAPDGLVRLAALGTAAIALVGIVAERGGR